MSNAPRLAAAIAIGIFMGFTALSAIFIFALFPLPNPLIDQRLIAVDAALGYDWAGFVTGLADWPPGFGRFGWLYLGALAQMMVLIVTLAVMRRTRQMHCFLLTGVIAMTLTIAFWWLWPSIGPSAYAGIAPEVIQRIGLLTTPAVGAGWRDLVEFGPAVITPTVISGVVAFPSFHMIMALMVAFYARRTPLFPFFATASLCMIPATLSHGGHHLSDIFGGVVFFALAAWLSQRLVPGA